LGQQSSPSKQERGTHVAHLEAALDKGLHRLFDDQGVSKHENANDIFHDDETGLLQQAPEQGFQRNRFFGESLMGRTGSDALGADKQ
jgi:hypothetical protein